MESIPTPIITLLIGVIVTIVSIWYGQNHGLLPAEASAAAPAVDGLFNTMVTIAMALFLLVQGVLIYVGIRYRRKPGDNTDALPVHGNIPLEVLWTSIPAVIVLGLAVYSFDVYMSEGAIDPMSHSAHHRHSATQVASHSKTLAKGAAIAASLDSDQSANVSANLVASIPDGIKNMTGAKSGDAVEVNVTGLQFAWIFTYPQDGVVSGELHIPVDRPIVLNISANDVLHAFWVPEFRLKQDAIPGRTTQLQFVANRIGTYPVICAELCGSYHGGMKTQVHVYSAEDYDAWLQSQKAVATTDREQVVAAVSPSAMSDADYLAPYAQEFGVNSAVLHSLHENHSLHSTM
ncbi:MAG: cytochrome c oxidase subunit II [Cyanobacteria bacterium]|nr:cytochrome c oxidase subunit II [Cyanobacteriota bacterium]MDW8200442.1 cytochrome c oxidase subunit II [Cyanobacteriota bacterium SKYGB_h_bin112]